MTTLDLGSNLFHGNLQSYEIDTRALNQGPFMHIERDFNGNVVQNPILVHDSLYEGPQDLILAVGLNGVDGLLNAQDNSAGTVPPLAFIDTGLPAGIDLLRLTRWSALYKNNLLEGMPVAYAAGDLVMFDDEHLYRAVQANMMVTPGTNASVWEDLGLPVDDLRQACDAATIQYGLLDGQ